MLIIKFEISSSNQGKLNLTVVCIKLLKKRFYLYFKNYQAIYIIKETNVKNFRSTT